MRASWLLLTGGALAAAPLLAQSATTASGEETAQGNVAVTIYNNNLALVQDIRQMNVPAGTSRQEFPDVSAAIRPETVSLTGADFGIVEQNFDYDLLSPGKLMEKAVGQTVTLLRTNPATGAETRERAKVLATNGGVVIQVGERIEVLRDDGLPVRVIFDRVPPNLRAKPTLSVTMDSTRAGTRPLTLSYLTTGLGWRADYVSLFDEKAGTINMQGWITLTNSTGTTFTAAETILVAGEVGQVQQGYGNDYGRGRPVPMGNKPGTETGSREQLGDFYLYPIKERTTIANAQTKQVSFLDVIGAKATKSFEYRNGWMDSQDEARSASSVLKFSSSRQGGIGDAMPAGTVRVYMKDARGQPQFIGENAIGHTPGGSNLAIKTGEAFDVKVQPFVEKREKITSDEWEKTVRYRIVSSTGRNETVTVERQKEYWRTTMRYVVTNAKSQPVTVDLIQSGLNRYWYWPDDRVVSETIKGEQINANERLWQVPVPANGETIVTVVFDSRY
jgi:hypothetical protein